MSGFSSERAADARMAPRSNMYIAATLSWPDGFCPAKVRNMSATGALIEAPVVPPAGTTIWLGRGSLGVEGTIAWANLGRFGMRFQSLVAVRDWLAPAQNREQGRVDETIALLRAGAIPLHEPRQRQTGGSAVPGADPEQLATDLRDVCRMLDALGADLVQDECVARHHARALQSLDLAAQTLAASAELLLDSPPPGEDLLRRLHALRASRAQAAGMDNDAFGGRIAGGRCGEVRPT